MAQHYSFRVPWHDNGWNGTVCKSPSENYSCMRLKGVNQERNEELENENASCKLCDLECKENIPCIKEGSAFMSEDEIIVSAVHPYASFSDYHRHLLPTKEIIPAYTYPARPFKWVMRERWTSSGKKYIDEFAYENGIDYHEEYEPEMDNKTWVQDGRNQKTMFNAFFERAVENESICVFYAKQVPFIEDSRRVVIGLGHIQSVQPPIKYDMSNPKGMTSYAWENMVKHSVRPDMKDGFILPYYQLMAYAAEHKDFDIRTGTVFAADDYFEEFSYASEQLSHDAVIDVILQTLKAVEVYKACKLTGDWDYVIKWLNNELNNVWEDRGAFPGLGAVLSAFGIPSGPVVARELKEKCSDDDSIWSLVDSAIENPEQYLSDICASQIHEVIQITWKNLSAERRKYIELLSRVNLSIDQAAVLYLQEKREESNIQFEDSEIIDNPYLLYEKTRDKEEYLKISIKKVDLAFFPPDFIAKKYPVEKPAAMNSSVDKRRVRALLISMLENAAIEGNTLMPVRNMIVSINNLVIEPACPVTSDMISTMNDFLTEEVEIKQDSTNKDYYKLLRYKNIDKLIASQVVKRVTSKNRHVINTDWMARVNSVCDKFEKNPDSKIETASRQEKAAALKELAESRLSVLIGGAGTGKTTVLEILCQEPEIQDKGILLLAPTGKARVRMSQGLKGKVNFKAKTIAQFLMANHRYDWRTCTYRVLSSEEKKRVKGDAVPGTVIIDESSMITEDMLGALFDVINKAERIILVGDRNQLPPIGAGRPFVDIIRYIEKTIDIKDGTFPACGNSYAKLTITNRQKSDKATNKIRSDVRLAKWFTDDSLDLDEDIFEEIEAGVQDKNIVFKKWNDKEELNSILCNIITEITNMESSDDAEGFNKSLGGLPQHNNNYDGLTFFNYSKGGKPGCGEKAEAWQILSPVRNDSHGVIQMNHYIHNKYRVDSIELAERQYNKKIPSPMGPEGIVYGDKVINLTNKKRNAYPEENAENYVVNGEIGVACGGWNQNRFLNVEFSSQISYTYGYEAFEFGDEGNIPLELAYAITVHKSQGSQFNSVILVLSDKCFLMSRELLYTALTRQKEKLYILYDEDAYNLKKYSSMEYSDIAQRFTDLFEVPDITEYNNKFYESGLIHKTKDGKLVRSKSEVIIANMLYDNGIEDYIYEDVLKFGDIELHPDFSVIDAASGNHIIWEHLGMMGKSSYKSSWEAKKKLYEENGFSEENGNLIITMDSLDGAIDSEEIQRKIDEYLM